MSDRHGPLAPGDVIERYRVESLLGQGGMAAVYRVRHTELGTVRALKVLTVAGKGVRGRLLTEGKAQARLQHKNAVQVLDFFEARGAPMLLLEYVDGCDLDAWLRDHPIDLAEAERIFGGILDAVRAAHALGLIHRDLKPANVLMARDGDGWTPRVADFGLAKIVIGDASAGSTRTGVAMGTPSYMAPEQIRDAKHVDTRADLFSLGCILYTLVCGRQPFVGADVVELFSAITAGRYPPPEHHVPDLPARVSRTITWCLQVDPEDRPPDCAAIEASLRGRPPTPPAPTVPTVGSGPRSVTTPPTVLAAMALGALTLAGGAAGVVFLGVLWALSPDEEAVGGGPISEPTLGGQVGGPCPGRAGEVVGYAFFGRSRPSLVAGDTWTFRGTSRDVIADYPRRENGFDWDQRVVCTLTRDTVVTLALDPLHAEKVGWWIPIVPGSLKPP